MNARYIKLRSAGYSHERAERITRLHNTAARHGIVCDWQEEDTEEYGDDRARYCLHVAVYLPGDPNPVASEDYVNVDSLDDPHLDEVQAELIEQAMTALDYRMGIYTEAEAVGA